MAPARFFDGERATGHQVEVSLSGGNLIIGSPQGDLMQVWPITTVHAPQEPDPDGVVTFSIAGHPARLLVGDPDLLRALAEAGVRVRAGRAWSRRRSLIIVATGVMGLLLAVLALDRLPRWLASIIPPAWERELAVPVEAALDISARTCPGRAGQQALDRLVDTLRQAGGVAQPVRLTVLDDPLVNAFTLPGGHILVMRGLIEQADDGAELAGVIAHEMGHVAHADPTTLMVRQAGFSILTAALGLGDATSLGVNLSRDVLARSYGRAAETAADAAALEFLTKAGLRADGLGRFFERLEAIEGQPAGSLNWLDTHPPTEERRARAVRPLTGAAPFTAKEWDAIRAMCHGLPVQTGSAAAPAPLP